MRIQLKCSTKYLYPNLISKIAFAVSVYVFRQYQSARSYHHVYIAPSIKTYAMSQMIIREYWPTHLFQLFNCHTFTPTFTAEFPYYPLTISVVYQLFL